MTPIQHTHCNDILRAPEGDTECEDLHIRREDGHVWSFWTPNKEELAAIVKGGTIALAVAGQTHPPLSLRVMVPDYNVVRPVLTDPAEINALYEANRERCFAMTSIAKRAIAALVKAAGKGHEALLNEFLDLLSFNSSKDEVVRDLKGGEA